MASFCQFHLSNFWSDSILCFVIIFIFICPSIHMHCVHDKVQETFVTKTQVDYKREDSISQADDGRRRRHRRGEESAYKPIRITPEFMFGPEVTDTESDTLMEIVERAINRSSEILSVIPVEGPLLLDREPCATRWTEGINIGKCSQAKLKPEYCMDYLKIPTPHLKGYAVYNSTMSAPYHQELDGEGLNNTDYILYITAQVTRSCLDAKTTVIAYASYCRVDQNDRPVAGHINFCPLALRKSNYNEDDLYWIALHEIFHALGFSKSLFSKFKKCDKHGKDCSAHPPPIQSQEDGLLRLLTPKVKKTTQEHFKCFKKRDYGGPMDIANTSHWDSRTMQGSIMAAKFDMPHLTFIDLITLSLFEDSGWYQVDYTQADEYMWGREAGCEFGLNEYCDYQPEYFCKGETKGCHYLHWDKASCRTNDHVTPCRVFKANKGEECWRDTNHPTSNITLEVFSRDSRCFLANITKTHGVKFDLTPRCFHAHCFDLRTLMVRVDNSSWTVCPAGEYLKIPGYEGLVQCPSHPTHICSSVPRPLITTLPPTSTTQPTTVKVEPTVPYHTHSETTKGGSATSSAGLGSSSIPIRPIIFLLLVSALRYTHNL